MQLMATNRKALVVLSASENLRKIRHIMLMRLIGKLSLFYHHRRIFGNTSHYANATNRKALVVLSSSENLRKIRHIMLIHLHNTSQLC